MQTGGRIIRKATIYEARNNFSSLVKLAESGEPVELTRRDKPVAVIISYDEYERSNPKESFFTKLAKLKAEYADVLEGFEGFETSRDEFTSKDYEEYDEKISKLFSEE